jgi:GT2 family glycosyltransferase
MAYPKISIIWLNYNSMKILPLVLQSLESVASVDCPSDRFELIIVDNGSTDGSFEKVREFVERRSGLRKKIIKLDRNLGFTGGNNIGFMARDRESKYVLLLNNDAVLLQHGLKVLVEYAEGFERLGGLQGVVLRYGTRIIDSTGGFLDELLRPHRLGAGYEHPWVLRRPVYVTYVDGVAALFRVESVLRCVGNKLFVDELFAYYDDSSLCLLLWGCGYPSISVPEAVAYHARSSTFKGMSFSYIYLPARNRIASMLVSNSRHKQVLLLYMLRNVATSLLGSGSEVSKALARAFVDGVRLGRILRRKGLFIDLYKAPIIRVDPKELIHLFTSKHIAKSRYSKSIAKKIEQLIAS